MIILNIINKNREIEKKEFNKNITIGRLKRGVDVYLEDNQVSRRHCEIFKNNNRWFIKDLSSSNGTHLNGVKLSPFVDTLLNTQDIISIGNSKITVIIDINEDTIGVEEKKRFYYPILFKNRVVNSSTIVKPNESLNYTPHKTQKSSVAFNIFAMSLISILSLTILFLLDSKKINIQVNYVQPIEPKTIIRGVKVEKVETALLNLDIFFSGNLEPIKEEIYKSDFETKIDNIYVKEGDKVKDKTLLFSLDKSSFLKNVKNLKVKLKSYNLEVKKAKNEYNEALKSIKTAKSDVDLAKEKLEETINSPTQNYAFYNKDKNTLDRSASTAMKLAKLNSDSGQNRALRAKEKAIEDANNTYIDKKNLYNLALENKEFKKSNLDNLKIELEKAEANLDLVNDKSKNFKVYSTIGGFIDKIYFKENEEILENSAIIKIIDKSKLSFEIDLPKENRESIRLNSQIEVNIDNKNYIGHISFISKTLDDNQTYRVKITLNNDNFLLKQNSLAKIKLKENDYKKMLIVPKNSINDGKNGKYLFIVKDNIINKVDIKIIKEINDRYAIESENLTNSDLVVIDGDEKINNNQKVKIIDNNLTKN